MARTRKSKPIERRDGSGGGTGQPGGRRSNKNTTPCKPGGGAGRGGGKNRK